MGEALERQVAIKGRLANYWDMAVVKRPVMVLLHGWGQDAGWWRQVSQLLADKCRFIVPDLPGFGQSQLLAGTKSNVPEYASWVADFIGALGIKEDILAGHSAGGQIAAYAAAKGIIKPKKLLLVAPALQRYDEITVSFKTKWLIRLAKLKPLLPKKWVDLVSTATDYHQADGEQKKILQRIVRFNVVPFLPLIPSPTLCIWGERDRETLGRPKELAHLIPQGRLKIIYGAGHNLHLEKPAELAVLMADWIRDL